MARRSAPNGQRRPETVLSRVPSRERRTRKQFGQPDADEPPSGGQDVRRERGHRLFQMTYDGSRDVGRRLPAPARLVLIVQVGEAGTDRRELGDGPMPFERRLGHVDVRRVVLPKEALGLSPGLGPGRHGPLRPRPIATRAARTRRRLVGGHLGGCWRGVGSRCASLDRMRNSRSKIVDAEG
jgi:hypothetical protein